MKKIIINSLIFAITILLFAGCGNVAAPENADSATTMEDATEEDIAAANANGTEVSNDNTDDSTSEQNEAAATQENASGASDGIITEDDAKAIALKDAGLSSDKVSGMRIKLESDDGIQEYEVDFYSGNKEYEYTINASTGDIISKDNDIDDDFSNSESKKDDIISKDKAKKIALDKVSGATDKDIRIHLDNDDGKKIYEGSIVVNKKEYEFEIDARNGTILEWEEDEYDD